jgi:hypothetical protein
VEPSLLIYQCTLPSTVLLTLQLLLLLRRQYLQQLLGYLVSFYERTQPLAQLSKQLDKIQSETEEAFQQGQVRMGYRNSTAVVVRRCLYVQAGWQEKQLHRMVSVRSVNGCCLRVGNSCAPWCCEG